MGGTREMPLNYTTYLLSGLIPWLGIQESMAKSSVVIVNSSNLVKQVVFPIEVLPVKSVIASLATQSILLLLLIIYVLFSQHLLWWTIVLLPVIVVLQGLAMIGVGYVLSAVGVYFRDMKDFVQVFCIVGVYLIPAFYLPASVPVLFRPLLYLNPFSYVIWTYQDVLYFGRLEHWWAWIVFGALSLGAFVVGYRLFRKLQIMFGNVL